VEALVPVLLGFVAVLHLLPAVGVLSAARLESLYGVALREPNLLLLMRHRAVLFAALGLLLGAAAVREELRGAALACGFASVASFLLLARSGGPYNAALRRVARVDLAALAALVAAAVLGA
jgi:hypothetical protein